MQLQLDSQIDVKDGRELEDWAEAFDVLVWHIQQPVMVVGSNALAVKNYLYAKGHIGARSSSPVHDGG